MLYLLSIKVPTPIAIANVKKRTAINRVENKKENIFLSIFKELHCIKVAQKYLKMLICNGCNLLIKTKYKLVNQIISLKTVRLILQIHNPVYESVFLCHRLRD